MSRGFLDEDADRAPDVDGDDAREVEVTGKIVQRAGRALDFDAGTARNWVPLSQIRGSRQGAAGVVTLRLPIWLAREKGFI